MMLQHRREVFAVTFYGDQATPPLSDETETESCNAFSSLWGYSISECRCTCFFTFKAMLKYNVLYHGNFCRPINSILFDVAFGVTASCFGIIISCY